MTLEQSQNRKTLGKIGKQPFEMIRMSLKRLLPVSFENIAFSRLVPGKQPLNLSIAYRAPGNAHG